MKQMTFKNARLRCRRDLESLPDLSEGDCFTVRRRQYTIKEIYWGYKAWINRELLPADLIRGRRPRSVACRTAFVVLSAF